ncbi:hypothetical protein QAD02_012407 [Eretmocerus hayati]|uniref:Uncharacterized protein n=1 Tax=Eretmocerus hayati TaxID=131215 RepID=A0ACC2P4C9_9HYME|nr:hypothetical protein QAD02_012407 [Eretmocerus hayati]
MDEGDGRLELNSTKSIKNSNVSSDGKCDCAAGGSVESFIKEESKHKSSDHCLPWRVFINHTDSYHGSKLMDSPLEDVVVLQPPEQDKQGFMDELWKCGFIIYDITQDDAQCEEAEWVLNGTIQLLNFCIATSNTQL